MPTAAYADGSMQFGSQSVVIGGQSYDAKNIKVQRPRTRILQKDIGGAPKQKVHIAGLVEGSMTVQLGSSTQVAPAQDVAFTLVPIGGSGTVSYVTEQVSDTYEMEGETVCEVTFSKKLT
jgi:hypothetical protein